MSGITAWSTVSTEDDLDGLKDILQRYDQQVDRAYARAERINDARSADLEGKEDVEAALREVEQAKDEWYAVTTNYRQSLEDAIVAKAAADAEESTRSGDGQTHTQA